jgi:hypothetical protein
MLLWTMSSAACLPPCVRAPLKKEQQMSYDTNDDQYEWVTNTDGRRVRVLRDGGVTRVPLTLMDATQRAIYNAVHDGSIEKLRQLRDQAYRDRESADQAAWQGDADKKVCPSCGFDLSEGDLTRAGGSEIDDAVNPRSAGFNLDAARAARTRAYLDLEREQQDAWRGGQYAVSEGNRE